MLCAVTLSAQKSVVINIWPDGAPTSNGLSGEEVISSEGNIKNISVPTLTVYPAARPNGQAVIMCPGGGYSVLCAGTEGHDMAKWFNAQGITFAVLKYRLPNKHPEVPLEDALQAIRLLRQHASQWKIETVGIMGASAGGHLATTASVRYTADSRPDFQILLYPRISLMTDTGRKSDTHDNLLGKNPAKELEEYYSAEQHVTENTPPAFIAHSTNDNSVPIEVSIDYYLALIHKNVSASIHVYPYGGHGWGFNDAFVYKPLWTEELSKWLSELRRK